MIDPAEQRGADLRRAVFLDRDGVLNRENGFVTSPDEFEILPGVPESLLRLVAADFALVVVTNQSGLARGLFDWRTLHAIHAKLHAATGARIDAIFVCPHHPEVGTTQLTRVCPCRKPEPGMLVHAAGALGLDLDRSWLVGDAPRDIEAGQRAGVRTLAVTGPKIPNADAFPPGQRAPEGFHSSLLEATEVMLGADAS